MMDWQRELIDVPEAYTEISSAYCTSLTPSGGVGRLKR